MTTPWAPPHHTTGAPTQLAPPPGEPIPLPYAAARPESGPRLGIIIAAFSALVLAAIAVTAGATTAIVRSSASTQISPIPTEPHYTVAEQQAAKDNVCRVFDASTNGQAGKGGMRIDGQLNMPLAIRTLTGIVALQDALTLPVPRDVSDAARRYVAAALELTTAATDPRVSSEEGNRLNDADRQAIFTLSDVCGLPR